MTTLDIVARIRDIQLTMDREVERKTFDQLQKLKRDLIDVILTQEQ